MQDFVVFYRYRSGRKVLEGHTIVSAPSLREARQQFKRDNRDNPALISFRVEEAQLEFGFAGRFS